MAATGPARLDGDATTPLLKWQGGKRSLVPLLSAAVAGVRTVRPGLSCYAEPFMGAGGSLLGLLGTPSLAGLATHAIDANPHVMNLHRQVVASPSRLSRVLDTMDAEVTATGYRRCRDAFNLHAPKGPLNAARLLWLNRACFNGIVRFNRDGGFNTHVGTLGPTKVPSLAWMQAVQEALEPVTLQTGDYHDLRLSRPGLVYCDPPYLGGFTDYTPGGFSDFDHYHLARRCRTWTRQGHVVLLSNANTEQVHSLYRAYDGWRVLAEPQVRRSSGATADRRGHADEVLMVLGLQDAEVRTVKAAMEET